MSTLARRFTISQFGGLYDGDPELAVPENSAQTADNIRFVPDGISPQHGFARVVATKASDSGGTARKVTAMYDYQDGEDQHVLAVAGDRLLELGDPTTIPSSWTVLTAVLATDPSTADGLPHSFVTAFGRCYFQSGFNDPLVYDGRLGTPASPEVFEWGIDAATDASIVTAKNAIGGEEFGEFESFDLYHGWWSEGPLFGSNSGEQPIGDAPTGWQNINDTRTRRRADTPQQLGTSVELRSGYRKGKAIATGAYKLNQTTSRVTIDTEGLTTTTTPVAHTFHPNGFRQAIDHQSDYDEWKVVRDRINFGGQQTKIRIGTEVKNLTAIKTVVSGRFYDLGVDSDFVTVPTLDSKNFEYYEGPFDGILQREVVVEEDVGGNSYSLTSQVKSDHAGVRVRLISKPSNTETVVIHSGGGEYENLKLEGGSALAVPATDTQLFVELEVFGDVGAPLADQLNGRLALFDELRVIEGTVAPDVGGALTGVFRYKHTFVDENDSTFSDTSPQSSPIEVEGGVVNLEIQTGPNGNTAPPYTTLPEHPVTHVYVYRSQSLDDGLTFGPFHLVKTIDITTIAVFPFSFTDTLPPVEAEEADIAVEDLITPPRGKFIRIFEGQMIVAGVFDKDVSTAKPADGRRLFHSVVNQPGVFKDDGFVEIDTRDNDQLTGIEVQGARIWAFTKDSIWEITNFGDDFVRTAIRHNGIGCSNGFAISNFQGIVFFPFRDGWYAMDAGGQLTRISRAIEKTFSESLDESVLASALTQDKKLWFNASDAVLVYDLEQGSKWSRMDSDIPMQALASVDIDDRAEVSETVPKRRELLLSDKSGYVYVTSPILNSFGGDALGLQGFTFIYQNVWFVDTSTATTVTRKITGISNSFPTAGDGLAGTFVSVIDENGVLQTRLIVSNTDTIITVGIAWTTNPSEDDTLTTGFVNDDWLSNKMDFGDGAAKKRLNRLRASLISQVASANLLANPQLQFARGDDDPTGVDIEVFFKPDGELTKWEGTRARHEHISVGIRRNALNTGQGAANRSVCRHLEGEVSSRSNKV